MSLRPSLQDVSLTIDDYRLTDPREFFFVHRMYSTFAAQMVWTYSPPSDDPKIEDDARIIGRVTFMSTRMADKLKTATAHLFRFDNGFMRPARMDWIRIARQARDPLSETTRAIAKERHNERCAYCGSDQGPFEFDHLFPRSRGGSDQPNNIVLACEPCNRSKRDMTLMEWVASLLPDEQRIQP